MTPVITVIGYNGSVHLAPTVPDTELPEAELVLRAQEDPRAFEALYDRYFIRVLRFLALRTPSPEVAEDIASQTFLNAFEHLDRYRPTAPFGAWIFRIARNLLIDSYRVSGRTIPLREDLPLASDANIPAETERTLQLEALGRHMNALSPLERDVLTLRVGSELSHAEIGATLGKSEAAVKVAFSRAVQRLRTLLVPPAV